jgi:hypothetical protein
VQAAGKRNKTLRGLIFFCIPPAHFLFLFYKNKNKKGWALLLLCFYSYFTLAFANCKKQEQKE